MKRRWKIPARKGLRRGQAIIEFALVGSLVLLFMTFMVIDLSRMIATTLRLSSVAREGGRLFVAYEISPSQSDAYSYINTNVYAPIKDMMFPDDVASYGQVVISTITRDDMNTTNTSDDQLKINYQFYYPSSPRKTSQLGGVGTVIPTSTLPVETLRIGENMVVVEIYYPNPMITPIKSIVKMTGLDWLYERAFF